MSAVDPMQGDPVLSVLMITYNHERFVEQAVGSALMQETDFPWEIVISDDASTDRTASILKELAEKNERIRLILRERNAGAVPNFHSALEQCRGRYVALLEGDDYWTDPRKLQRQMDTIRTTNAVLCLHRADALEEKTGETTPIPPLGREIYRNPVALAAETAYIPTASAMFDRNALGRIPPQFGTLGVGDIPMWMLLAARGEVRVLPHAWSIYRVHAGGIWTGMPPVTRPETMTAVHLEIAATLGREPSPKAGEWRAFFLRKAQASLHKEILSRVESGQWRTARTKALKYLFGWSCPQFLPPKGFVGLYLRLIFGMPSDFMRAYEQRVESSTW